MSIRLGSDLVLAQKKTLVFCDSQSVIDLTNNQMFHESTKYIEVRRHFRWDIVSKGIVNMKKMFTHNNLDRYDDQGSPDR